MTLGQTLAMTALTGSLVSNNIQQYILNTHQPITSIQDRAYQSRIILQPKYAPSDGEIRPELFSNTSVDLTYRDQILFNEWMSGRSWAEEYTRLHQPNQTLSFNYMVVPSQTDNPLVTELGEGNSLSSVPAPTTLAITGLGLLVAARRMRR